MITDITYSKLENKHVACNTNGTESSLVTSDGQRVTAHEHAHEVALYDPFEGHVAVGYYADQSAMVSVDASVQPTVMQTKGQFAPNPNAPPVDGILHPAAANVVALYNVRQGADYTNLVTGNDISSDYSVSGVAPFPSGFSWVTQYGSYAYATVAGAAIALNQDFEIEHWILIPTFSGLSPSPMNLVSVGAWGDNASEVVATCAISDMGQNTFCFRNGDGTTTYTSEVIQTNTWYHIRISRSSNLLVFRINGNVVGQTTTNGYAVPGGNIFVNQWSAIQTLVTGLCVVVGASSGGTDTIAPPSDYYNLGDTSDVDVARIVTSTNARVDVAYNTPVLLSQGRAHGAVACVEIHDLALWNGNELLSIILNPGYVSMIVHATGAINIEYNVPSYSNWGDFEGMVTGNIPLVTPAEFSPRFSARLCVNADSGDMLISAIYRVPGGGTKSARQVVSASTAYTQVQGASLYVPENCTMDVFMFGMMNDAMLLQNASIEMTGSLRAVSFTKSYTMIDGTITDVPVGIMPALTTFNAVTTKDMWFLCGGGNLIGGNTINGPWKHLTGGLRLIPESTEFACKDEDVLELPSAYNAGLMLSIGSGGGGGGGGGGGEIPA